MNINFKTFTLFIIAFTLYACNTTKKTDSNKNISHKMEMMNIDDGRVSLHLNAMQKHHQLSNMRAHLKAVQTIVNLIAQDDFQKASDVAYKELGSTTEMRMMCASFDNKTFETMGLEFHKSADKMSAVLKTGDKAKSLEALATTMNYCVNCHAMFKQ